MTRILTALLLVIAAGALRAQGAPQPDPLSSRECAAAREELDQALAQPGRKGRDDRLLRARQRAASACLGRDSGSRERSGAPEPAQMVPPVLPPPPRGGPPLPAIVPAAPPVNAPRPAITMCDPAGCWDSEGRRLNNMGPVLVGPRGVCTLQAGVLNCP